MNMRVRFAPSPTGSLHVGNLRTALYDYLAARSSGGTFILRIEDTDQERSTPESIDVIYRSFAWLGVHWDEGPDVGGPYGPYVQSQRRDLYQSHARKLVDEGKAYYCFCSEERLDQLRREQTARKQATGYDRACRSLPPARTRELLSAGHKPVIRFAVPLEGETVLHDELLGDVRRRNVDVSADPVIVKSDGLPTYHLAHPVDDHHMAITHVLRGQEWLPSGHLHLLLFKALGWEAPAYYHLPVVLGTDGQKLSKRHGASSVEEFGERGFLPEALINYLARLGWSHDEKTEFFPREELERLFSLSRLSKSPAVFDYKKLTWLNGQHMRRRSPSDIAGLVRRVLIRDGLLPATPSPEQEAILEKAVPLIHERLALVSDASQLLRFALVDELTYPPSELLPKGLDASRVRALLGLLRERTAEVATTSDEELEARMRALAAEQGLKVGDLLMPLRVAVTGSRVSPPLFGCMRLIGIDRVSARVERAIGMLGAG
jgi:glutamyl-tRNA synthetase